MDCLLPLPLQKYSVSSFLIPHLIPLHPSMLSMPVDFFPLELALAWNWYSSARELVFPREAVRHPGHTRNRISRKKDVPKCSAWSQPPSKLLDLPRLLCGCQRSRSSTPRAPPQAWHSHQASSLSSWRRDPGPQRRDAELMAAPGKGFLSGRA